MVPVRPAWRKTGRKLLTWGNLLNHNPSNLTAPLPPSCISKHFLQNPPVPCSPNSWLSHLSSFFHLQITLLLLIIQSKTSPNLSWGSAFFPEPLSVFLLQIPSPFLPQSLDSSDSCHTGFPSSFGPLSVTHTKLSFPCC